MSEPSDHSEQLAAQLRETALKNLGRSGAVHRSTISGQFVSGAASGRHARKTTTERTGSGTTPRRSITEQFRSKRGKGF